MSTRPLPLGNGVNLDMDDSTVKDTTVSLINCYIDRGGAAKIIPGCVEYVDTGAGNSPVWAYYCVNHAVMLIVSNARVWKQSERGGALTELTGVDITPDVPPTFAEDGTDLFFAAKSKIHIFDPFASAAAELGANSPTDVTSIAYIRGYLKACGVGATDPMAGDTHYSDDKANGYAAWELYNNEARPDALMSLVVAYEQIYNIGRLSTEVSYVDGTVPFSVNKNAAQHFGTPAKYSVAFDGENIYYISEVASSRKIISLRGGGTPSVISFPIDVPIEQFERVDDAQGFIMAWAGQNGYAITFPNANAVVDEQYYHSITFFYHLQTKEWIILGKWDEENGEYGPYRGVSFTYVESWGGLRLIGGRDGKLYELQPTTATEYEEAPTLSHRWRDDGKKEWRNARSVSLGLPGQYKQWPRIGPCGSFRSRQHQIVFTDLTDAGEIMRAAIKTGQVSHKSPRTKRNSLYRYDLKVGKSEFTLNAVSEEFDYLRN
jgi:hypothetical protein